MYFIHIRSNSKPYYSHQAEQSKVDIQSSSNLNEYFAAPLDCPFKRYTVDFYYGKMLNQRCQPSDAEFMQA